MFDADGQDLDLVALRDGDTMSPVGRQLPPGLASAVEDVARILDLPTNWMNGGPDSLLRFGLPDGSLQRGEPRVHAGLSIPSASRFDQTHSKLNAAADD